MSAARALALGLSGLGLLFAGLAAHSFGGVLLEFAGLGLLLWLFYTLVGPLAQERVYYRVRYHYPATMAAQNETRAGALLRVLARRGGRVDLYWRREEAGLALFIAVSATVEAAFRGMLPEIWPGAVVERVRELPAAPQEATCLYRVKGAAAAMQFDFAALFADPTVTPTALWLHLTAAGWATLVGAPRGEHKLAGLRLQPVPGNSRFGAAAWLAWLYPFVRPWPGAATARDAKSAACQFAPCWPRTDLVPSLDAETALILPPTPGYKPPARLWQLGRAASGGLPIGLDLARERSWGHVLVSGGTSGDRQSTALRLLAQAGAAGWNLVVLDHSGRLGKQLYELAPAAVRRHSARIDLHARRGTVRPGLLDVAPPAADPAGQAQALLIALETRLPAYLRFLGQLGLHGATLGPSRHPAREIAPADVTVQLLAHYRARLSGAAAPALPEVPALYASWGNASGFAARLQREVAGWGQPQQALGEALAVAGAAGTECARRVEHLLDAATANLAALDPADLQLYSGSLRARLAPAATAPLLRVAWSELTPVSVALDGPLVLGNLSYSDSGERGAARMYGLYLLALLEAFAQERALLGQAEQPTALAWEELAPAWNTLKPADIARLGASLRSGAMHLIALDESWNGLDEAQGAALRATLDNWVIGTLPAGATTILGGELLDLGAPDGFSCSALPPGHALARVHGEPCDMLCTVITTAREMGATAVGERLAGHTPRAAAKAGLPAAAADGISVPVAIGASAPEVN